MESTFDHTLSCSKNKQSVKRKEVAVRPSWVAIYSRHHRALRSGHTVQQGHNLATILFHRITWQRCKAEFAKERTKC